MIKILNYAVNYHGKDIAELEETKYYYTNMEGESLLLIDDDIDLSGLSDDLREELKEGLKHKNYVYSMV